MATALDLLAQVKEKNISSAPLEFAKKHLSDSNISLLQSRRLLIALKILENKLSRTLL